MKWTHFCLYNIFFFEIKSSVKRERGKLKSGSFLSSSAIFIHNVIIYSVSSIIPQGPPPSITAPKK